MYLKLPGGSLFLFDRKVLRYFRKDGHNWRKKKDGKTVKEAHEKLKVSNAALEDELFVFLLVYNCSNPGSLNVRGNLKFLANMFLVSLGYMLDLRRH